MSGAELSPTSTDTPLLTLSGPLSVLDAADRAALFALGGTRRYRRDEAIVHQGTPNRDVHVLLEGRVSIMVSTREGREILIALRGPGDTLGELAAFDPEPRFATISAIEDVATLVVTGDRFVRFISERPPAMLAMIRLLAQRSRESDRHLIDALAENTLTRLARRLLELGARYGVASPRGLDLDIPLSQQRLADWVGVSREAVNGALRRLRDSGVVATGRLHVTLLDVDELRSVAAEVP